MNCETCKTITNLRDLVKKEAAKITDTNARIEWAKEEKRRQQIEALTLLEAVLEAAGLYELSNRSGRNCKETFIPKLELKGFDVNYARNPALSCYLPHNADHVNCVELIICFDITTGSGCAVDCVPRMEYKAYFKGGNTRCFMQNNYGIESVDLAARHILLNIVRDYTSKECLARIGGEQ